MQNYIIRQLIKNKINQAEGLAKLKRQAALKFKQTQPTNIKLLQAYHELLKNSKIKKNLVIESLLKTREVRTLSGVAVITVLTKPYPCPGRCLYCPDEKGMPKSYLSNEPAAMRAILNKFDPYDQVKMRLEALSITGHKTDKIELIVLGGTWSAYPRIYQLWFIKECFRAGNNSKSKTKTQKPKLQFKIQNLKKLLKKEQQKNETAPHRIVGLTLETRPDFISHAEIKKMRELGCTRLELGVQSIYKEVLKINRREHDVSAIIKATKLLKDAGFKINYHMMLNLPGSDLKKDKKMFGELFSGDDFQPDLLKIYPCSILKNAPLYKLWLKKKFRPYAPKTLFNLLVKIKQQIPPYVRIVRIIRDIPAQSIVAGNKVSNLRQKIAEDKNKICQCIRCREIKNNYSPNVKIKLFRQDYRASQGQEIFLSYEDTKRKNLYALLRLRIPAPNAPVIHFLPALENAALIREVHTYGELVPLRSQNKQAAQHTGLGKKLIQEAEKIASGEFGFKKMAVIAGVGVRNYYRKIGYQLKNNYMVKSKL